jgi:hypothetical protein
MSYGSIYESTHWGDITNTMGWGKIYRSLVESLIVRPLASTTRIFADTIEYLASNLFG